MKRVHIAPRPLLKESCEISVLLHRAEDITECDVGVDMTGATQYVKSARDVLFDVLPGIAMLFKRLNTTLRDVNFIGHLVWASPRRRDPVSPLSAFSCGHLYEHHLKLPTPAQRAGRTQRRLRHHADLVKMPDLKHIGRILRCDDAYAFGYARRCEASRSSSPGSDRNRGAALRIPSSRAWLVCEQASAPSHRIITFRHAIPSSGSRNAALARMTSVIATIEPQDRAEVSAPV